MYPQQTNVDKKHITGLRTPLLEPVHELEPPARLQLTTYQKQGDFPGWFADWLSEARLGTYQEEVHTHTVDCVSTSSG